MNPLAVELNEQIQAASPATYALLSARGRALYFPRGILSQTAEAREKAHRFNATIGEATRDHAPMGLPSVTRHFDIDPRDALSCAPAAGRADLRQAWRAKLLRENPAMGERSFGLPIVTSAITHGLSLVGDLFVDPGDRIVVPDKLWGNYRLGYEVRLEGRVETYPMYAGDGFNVQGLADALSGTSARDKAIVLLNFPNNPTGYMPTRAEVEGMRDALVHAAESGQRLVVVCDDAYFGLVFADTALDESPFGLVANTHPNLLAIKLDGATKELFVWGLRCGFLTFAPPPGGDADVALAALERKVMGAIRAGISNCSNLSQSVVLAALRSESLAAERRANYELLRARAQRTDEVARRAAYADSWDVYPFNAGYFMCVRVKGVQAEVLRLHLLDHHGVGLIALGEHDLRVAFSCLELEEIEPLFERVHRAIEELRSA